MNKSRQDQNTSTLLSRREFIKNSMLAAGAAGALATVDAVTVKAATTSGKLALIVSGYKLDRTEALIDGRVQVEGCDIKFEASGIGDITTNVLSGPQTLDVTEIGLHPFMLADANEGFRDYSLLPICPIRVFRHKAPIAGSTDLKTCGERRWQHPAFPRFR
jgi:4,5-dihydroxyphthalate decarboxylase